MQVDHIGGHLSGSAGRDIFGAIVALMSPNALPSGSPFNPGEVLAFTTFTTPSPSTDVLTPLSVTLAPGTYGLVFGSGLFGATGDSAMPNNNSDIPGSASYFTWVAGTGPWRNVVPPSANIRFVVTGTPGPGAPIPEPGTLLLLGSGIVGMGAVARRRRQK